MTTGTPSGRGGQQTVAEQVQVMLGFQKGRLERDGTMMAAAALIELVLAGRISSVPNRGFFNGPAPRKLVVADATATENDVLDAALLPAAGWGKPRLPHRALSDLGAAVSLEVQQVLERTGMVRAVKRYPQRGAYLAIVDQEAYRIERDRLAIIRSRPDLVDDARTGAFIDVLRNGATSFTGESGPRSHIEWEWYPPQSRETIESILQAEATRFSYS